MKVALLGPYALDPNLPADRPPLPGGVEAVVLALAIGLAQQQGVEVSVVTALPGIPRLFQAAGEGFSLFCVLRPRGGRLTGQRAVVAALRDQVRALRPDIVHAHIAGVYARAALETGLPSVVTLHGIIRREMQQAWPGIPWSTRLRWLIDARAEGRAVAAAREIIAISPYVLAEFRHKTAARFHLIENPVADAFFADAARPAPGAQRILCVARIIPRKGILALIEAFATVAQAHPGATLALAGELGSAPGYVAACRGRAAALGVASRVIFLGALPPEQVRAEYAAADIFALASEQETAPVSIAEAMAAGRPVVTSDVGGCAAMVEHGVTGLVVPPRDGAALADALAALLADPTRAARMGQAGHAAAYARFRLGPVVEKTLAVYRQVIDAKLSAAEGPADRRRGRPPIVFSGSSEDQLGQVRAPDGDME